MYGVISYEEIENGDLEGKTLFIDVRSPKEYADSTIPGAVNMPIFTNDERVEIGTIYDSGDIKKAKEIGVEKGCEKFPEYYKRITKYYEEYKNIVIFCARGGYRSKSVFLLLRALSINVYQLKGGYKGYRKHISDNLQRVFESVNYVVLHGKTGSGKTNILHKLENMGLNVLDLEGCANHRGSLLGSISLGKQNTQKMFESLVYHALYGKEGKTVFTEGESKRIGRIIMPNYMYEKLQNSTKVMVNASMDYRVNNIKNEYVNDNDQELISALDLLKTNISKSSVEEFKDKILQKDYDYVIENLMIKYYDRNYRLPKNYDFELENIDDNTTASLLAKKYI